MEREVELLKCGSFLCLLVPYIRRKNKLLDKFKRKLRLCETIYFKSSHTKGLNVLFRFRETCYLVVWCNTFLK